MKKIYFLFLFICFFFGAGAVNNTALGARKHKAQKRKAGKSRKSKRSARRALRRRRASKSSRKRAALRAMRRASRAIKTARRKLRRSRKGLSRKSKKQWQEAKEELAALLKKAGIAHSRRTQRLQPGAYGLPKRIGVFPISPAIAPRVRFWSKIFGQYRSNEIVAYNPRNHIIITHYRIKGADLSPDDPPAIRKKKGRIRYKYVTQQVHNIRKTLRILARFEAQALKKEHRHWTALRKKLCKPLRNWRTRRLCKQELRFGIDRFSPRRWRRHFASIPRATRALWRQINKEPYAKGPHRHQVFRLLAKQRISWQSSYRGFYRKGLQFEQRYRPHIQKILRKAKLPPQLAALPFVESMYNPWVRSYVGALGLWQLMPNTGKEISLYVVARRNNKKIFPLDERLDPLFATHGATRFLRLCRYYFPNSWPLAITSYNQGPGRMLRESRRAGRRNLDTIISSSRNRTFGFDGRNFYAKFVASAFILARYNRFFRDVPKRSPLRYKKLHLSRPIWLKDLSRLSGMSTASLKLFNPAFIGLTWNDKYPIPAYYPLRLSTTKYKQHKQKLHRFSRRGNSIKFIRSTRHDNFYRLSRRHDIPWQILEKINRPYARLKRPRRRRKLCMRHQLKHHKTLSWGKPRKKKCKKISPSRRLERDTLVRIPAILRSSPLNKTTSYKVRGDEPLGYIACQSCTTIWHLRYLNPTLPIKRLRPGTVLRVPTCTRARRRLFRSCRTFHFKRRRRARRRKRRKRRRYRRSRRSRRARRARRNKRSRRARRNKRRNRRLTRRNKRHKRRVSRL